MKLLYLCSLLLVNMIPGDHSQPYLPAAISIEGVVTGKNNQPVSQAYLFVVKGEEETISGSNGKFLLTTWQKFPVTLSVEHPDFKKVKLVIKAPGIKQIIRLEQQ